MDVKKRQVLIVHYNTPELTEAAILSLRKHGGEDYRVTVFDNSDARPFNVGGKPLGTVEVIDNTLGQLIDLDAEIRKFTGRSRNMGNAYVGDFPSARHMLSVQWFMDQFDGDGFLLMDSDVIVRESVDFMFMPDHCCCGHIQTWQKAGNPGKKDRLVPLLCYIGAKKCRECGVRYFNPDMTFALHAGGTENMENWYDTGSSFLYEIRSHKNGAHGKAIDIRELMYHFGSASWQNTGLQQQMLWLGQIKNLWEPERGYQLGDPTWAPPANKTARIYICSHADFEQKVTNPVFEVVDAREEGDFVEIAAGKAAGTTVVPGAFYSELLQMRRVAKRKKLPTYIGFCQYRKYFHWMDNVPDLGKWVKRYGCLVSQAKDLEMSVYDHYRGVGNVKDLDIATDIIDKMHPEFAQAWRDAMASKLLHPYSMFVMKQKDFKRIAALVSDVVDKYMNTIGGDIDAWIDKQPEAYHLPGSTLEYQRRVGGQLCERIVSAWIDWQFPEAKEVPLKFTSKPLTAK